MIDNKKKSAEIKKELKPHTIWDEFAKIDILIEYLRKFIGENINTNPDLNSSLIEALYLHSNEIIPEVEYYYAEKLNLSLKYFLNKISLCQNQKQLDMN